MNNRESIGYGLRIVFLIGLIIFILVIGKIDGKNNSHYKDFVNASYPPPTDSDAGSDDSVISEPYPSAEATQDYSMELGESTVDMLNSYSNLFLPIILDRPCALTDGHHAVAGISPNLTFGGHMRFAEVSYSLPVDVPEGGFVLGAVWNAFSDGDHLEIGYSRGWHTEDIYVFSVAWVKNGVYNDYKFGKSPSGPGTLHTYDIYPVGGGSYSWIMALDGFAEFFMITMNSTTATELTIGGEISNKNSVMEPTNFEEFIYYFSPNKGLPQPWTDGNVWCADGERMKWDWVGYPTSGKAWTP